MRMTKLKTNIKALCDKSHVDPISGQSARIILWQSMKRTIKYSMSLLN